MKRFRGAFREFFKRADLFLLTLSIICAVFGIIVISSATASYSGTGKYIVVQLLSMFLGIGAFVVMTVLDVDILADKWLILTIFNVVFIAGLIVFGHDDGTGNQAWYRFLGIGVQPTEIVKLTFSIVLAKQVATLQRSPRGLNDPMSAIQIIGHFMLIFVVIVVSTRDLGSALIFFFIFIVMLFAAGFALRWFAIGFAAIAAMIPLVWNFVLKDYQKQRILAPYDKTIDPMNTGINYQPHKCRVALASGRLTGTGLFHGTQSQSNYFPGKHTDFIYGVIGEELGMIACIIVILLLTAIIVRCVVVGVQSGNTMSALVCFSVAAFMTFQTFVNIGMCIGLTPVIGITLPFFSYGGSSLLATFAAMGMVSGVHYRPKKRRSSIYYY